MDRPVTDHSIAGIFLFLKKLIYKILKNLWRLICSNSQKLMIQSTLQATAGRFWETVTAVLELKIHNEREKE